MRGVPRTAYLDYKHRAQTGLRCSREQHFALSSKMRLNLLVSYTLILSITVLVHICTVLVLQDADWCKN